MPEQVFSSREALDAQLAADIAGQLSAAIAEREATGAEGLQLLRIRKAEITDASLDGTGMARVTVHYESELGDGETTTKASELWTFMRQTSSADPNWLLDDVDTAD